jgi:hypothetical protein
LSVVNREWKPAAGRVVVGGGDLPAAPTQRTDESDRASSTRVGDQDVPSGRVVLHRASARTGGPPRQPRDDGLGDPPRDLIDRRGRVDLDEIRDVPRDRAVFAATALERLDGALPFPREQHLARRVEIDDEIGTRIEAPQDRPMEPLRP